MGDPALADEKLIPPADGFDDPVWIRGESQMDYDAEARLVNENLLDFSHISFVHAESLGAGMDYAETVPDVIAMSRGVRFERWTAGKPFSRTSFKAISDPVDVWQAYEYHVPGILLSRRAVFPPGSAPFLKTRS